jgi:hypothetical protein
MEIIMKSPSITVTLVPAIEVLAKCLAQTSESYQKLLNDPESNPICREAGRSMRQLSKRYSMVLITALTYQSVSDDDENAATDLWDYEDDPCLAEDLDE